MNREKLMKKQLAMEAWLNEIHEQHYKIILAKAQNQNIPEFTEKEYYFKYNPVLVKLDLLKLNKDPRYEEIKSEIKSKLCYTRICWKIAWIRFKNALKGYKALRTPPLIESLKSKSEETVSTSVDNHSEKTSPTTQLNSPLLLDQRDDVNHCT